METCAVSDNFRKIGYIGKRRRRDICRRRRRCIIKNYRNRKDGGRGFVTGSGGGTAEEDGLGSYDEDWYDEGREGENDGEKHDVRVVV